MLFVCLGELADARAFFDRRWPGARAICDPGAELYRAFGIRRMRPLELLEPRLWAAALRAFRKGSLQGLPAGDVAIGPGLYRIERGRIAWSHVFRHAGDHPDLDALMAMGSRDRPSGPE